jgi:hypothetical protein
MLYIKRFKLEESYSLIPNLTKTKNFLINDDFYQAYIEYLFAEYRFKKIEKIYEGELNSSIHFSQIINFAYLITYIIEIARKLPPTISETTLIIKNGNELIEDVKSQLNTEELEEFNKYVPQKNMVLIPDFEIEKTAFFSPMRSRP